MSVKIREEVIWEALERVTDPELPTVSIVDMGMIKSIHCHDHFIEVNIIPTYVGCPALDLIKQDVVNQLKAVVPEENLRINFVLDTPWTPDRISMKGRENLKKMGVAPPPKQYKIGEEWVAECPYCQSPKTVMENLFGPTSCRSILYCTQCKNPFEAIKPI